jgi:hypothetical protein
MAQRSAMANRIISFFLIWSGGKIPLAFMVPALALFWDTGGLGRLCLVYYCDTPRHDLETWRCYNTTEYEKNILKKRHWLHWKHHFQLLFMVVMNFLIYDGLRTVRKVVS